MLVIADRDRAQAVAGVMGGAGAEVSTATRIVAFESAYFKPASVRRTSKRLGLKTEASSRFERGADGSAPVVAVASESTTPEPIAAVPAPEPTVAIVPSSQPSSEPVGGSSAGAGDHGRGGGWGGLLGGIIGTVVLRGGHGGIDKCDTRTEGRGRPPLIGGRSEEDRARPMVTDLPVATGTI